MKLVTYFVNLRGHEDVSVRGHLIAFPAPGRYAARRVAAKCWVIDNLDTGYRYAKNDFFSVSRQQAIEDAKKLWRRQGRKGTLRAIAKAKRSRKKLGLPSTANEGQL